jgi:hypothetical protein
MCHNITLLRGWVAGLPLICIKCRAPGYKAVGRAHIYDSITIINTINIPSCPHALPVNIDIMPLETYVLPRPVIFTLALAY